MKHNLSPTQSALLVLIISILLAAIAYFTMPASALAGMSHPAAFALGLLVGGLVVGLATVALGGASTPASTLPAAAAPAITPAGGTKTVFIGNLAFKASPAQLRELFARFGEVHSVRIMTDRATRRPRGFGFVEMDAAGADRAIAELDGAEFLGRKLRVNEGNERKGQEG